MSINRYAFIQAGEFGFIWRIYFVIAFTPEVFRIVYFFLLKQLKNLCYLFFLSRKISFGEFELIGFRKALHKIAKNE